MSVCMCVKQQTDDLYIIICNCTYTHIHFIRYTLLVPGWTPFSFRTVLILRGIDSTRCWKHYSEILVHIVMIASRSCCRFVVCTSMMWISRSTTSQRCSIGLRSGDCGGHFSKVNSLSCSRNQSEMIWALCIILLEVSEDWYTVVIKGWTWSATIQQKFWLWEIETCQTRQRFSNLLLSSFGDPVWIVSSVCCSYLTGAAPGVVFCCWSPSASGFDVLCVQRWYSAYLGSAMWLAD